MTQTYISELQGDPGNDAYSHPVSNNGETWDNARQPRVQLWDIWDNTEPHLWAMFRNLEWHRATIRNSNRIPWKHWATQVIGSPKPGIREKDPSKWQWDIWYYMEPPCESLGNTWENVKLIQWVAVVYLRWHRDTPMSSNRTPGMMWTHTNGKK